MSKEGLQNSIKSIKDNKQTLESRVVRTENTASSNEEKRKELAEKLNVIKRSFPGLFKKDINVREYVNAQRNIDRSERQANIYKNKIKHTEVEIDNAIIDFLENNDSEFKENQDHLKAVNEMRTVVNNYVELIEEAASDVDSAQGMETLDLFTDNKGISILSTMENSSASDSIEAVKEYSPKFKEAVEKFKNYLNENKIDDPKISEIGDILDLYFDMFFDGGFDFTSLFSLSALNDAEDDIEKLQEKVVDFQNKVDKIYQQYKDKKAVYIDALKKELKA
jgi:hypothetical protein